ncbi:hypothetical protein VUR80DRAFT_4195 [Thermomyces stellatus]
MPKTLRYTAVVSATHPDLVRFSISSHPYKKRISHSPYSQLIEPYKMCDFTKNFYIYTSCIDPGAHFFGTSVDGNHKNSCPDGPHERYIVIPGHCPLCGG